MNRARVNILLVEDNRADADLVKEIAEDKFMIVINVVSDGEQALKFLRRQGDYADAPEVALVLLDLNLPKMDGRRVLKEIKSDQLLRRIPVIVLTSSEADHDVISSYDLNANCYIKKPLDFDQFVQVLQLLNEFWFKLAKLPPRIEEKD
ncbi:MAG: response regulator [Bdellovibrionales bacterium]